MTKVELQHGRPGRNPCFDLKSGTLDNAWFEHPGVEREAFYCAITVAVIFIHHRGSPPAPNTFPQVRGLRHV